MQAIIKNLATYLYHWKYFPVVLIILFVICLLLFILLLHILIKELPYTKIDQRVSQILLAIPLLFSYYIYSTFDFLTAIIYLLLFSFVIIPILWYLKTYRWVENCKEFSLQSPLLYYDINIMFLYFYITILYIFFLRLYYTGIEINVAPFLTMEVVPVIILIICYIPVFVYLLNKLKNIKLYLWSRSKNVLYSIHLFLIQINTYFFFMEKLHKFLFCLRYLFLHKHIYEKQIHLQIIRKFCTFIYNKSYTILLLIFLFALFEIFLTKKLHHIFLVLIIYFICNNIIGTLYEFSSSAWVYDCCLSDFLYKSYRNTRYPYIFWTYFEDDSSGTFWFNIDNTFSSEEIASFTNLRKKYTNKNHTLSFTIPFNLRVENSRASWRQKMASRYRLIEGIRYVHTATQTLNAGSLHNGIGFLIKNPLHKAHTLNVSWSFYNSLNASLVKSNYPIAIYKPEVSFVNAEGERPSTFAQWVEINTPTFFQSLSSFNIQAKKGTIALAKEVIYKDQPCPDLILYLEDSLIDTGVHKTIAYDMKNVLNLGPVKIC